jgi:hypothetical protein
MNFRKQMDSGKGRTRGELKIIKILRGKRL